MAHPVRGDVFFAVLDPTRGSEQAGSRPVVIISRDALNRYSPAVLAVPLTTALKKSYPSHVAIPKGVGNLPQSSTALCEQVRAISKQRLGRSVGRLPAETMARIEIALKIALDLP
jgi:mRNA interferase MazF